MSHFTWTKRPHIHAVIVPIDEKGKLNARGYFGGREKMRGMQDSFAKQMQPLGLERGIKGSKARHVDVKEYYSRLNDQLDRSRHQYTLSEPPAILGKDKWVQQENQKINQVLEQTARSASLKELDQFYKNRKREVNENQNYRLKDEVNVLRQERSELKDQLSQKDGKLKNSGLWMEHFQREAMNQGLKFDMQQGGKLVKMTDQEKELYQKEQARKKAEYQAEQQRKKDQEKNRDKGMRM